MSDIVLSAGVRQNLLALQTTAKLMTVTQNRLATGKKVNTALDNPVNFFTASGLQSRASDLSALLDAMSNGVKTLQAADNGLTAMTKNIETMQSTLVQARQDKSFQTASYTLNAAAIGTTSAKTLTISGGSVGATPINFALNAIGTGGTQAALSTSAPYAAPVSAQKALYTAQNNYVAPGAAQALTLTFTPNGGAPKSVNVTLDTTETTLQEAIDKINAAILLDGDTNGVIQAEANGSKLQIATTGNVDGVMTVTGAGETAIFGSEATQAGSDGLTQFTVNGATVTLSSADSPNITAAVNTANLALLGANSAFEAFDNAGTLGIREKVAQGATLTIGGPDAGLFTATTNIGTAATGGAVKTVDEVVNAINTALAGKVSATNDNGKLRIENISTANLALSGITGGAVDGSATTATIDGNNVRNNLAVQFNQLRDQLDKIAQDSSFNGINLLDGDILKVIFNESATSTIDILAKDSAGNPFTFTATNLNLSLIFPSDLDSDSSIDNALGNIKQALNFVRSQSSTFGASLSIVENRQDFTKAMINTLQTGADNLVLADTNEEGANMLALQTRQQLSTTALSLAAQADQGVLRLFG